MLYYANSDFHTSYRANYLYRSEVVKHNFVPWRENEFYILIDKRCLNQEKDH